MGVTPRKALDMYGSLHLTISYLLRGKIRRLRGQVPSLDWLHRRLSVDLTWAWRMLGWCIVTLASARLEASMRFPPLRGMYQNEALARGVTKSV